MTSSADSVIQSNDGSATMQRLVLAQLCEQAAAAVGTGRPAVAERYYQCALDLDGENADLWALLGTVVQGARARMACARRALALVPDHDLARALLAGEVPRPGEPGNGGGDRAEPAPARVLPATYTAGAVPTTSSVSPAPDRDLASSDKPFRLSAPRLEAPPRPRPPRPRSPFWAGLRVPQVDLRALWRSLVPQGRAASRTVAPSARRPLALALPRLSFHWTRQARARLLIVAALVLVVAVNLGLAALYESKYADRIIPGVRIAGLDVGGLPPAQVERVLQTQVAAVLDRVVRLEYAGQSWHFTAAEVGLRYLITEAVEEAAGLGHRAAAWDSWRERARAGFGGIEVPLPVEAQQARLEAVLDRAAADVDRPAVPPAVSWQDGNWFISPGQDGRHVVRKEAKDRLLTALATLVNGDTSPGDIALQVDLPVITDSAALAAADFDRLRRELDLAAQPLTVRCAEHTWDLATSDIASWLRVKLAPPAVEVDMLALNDFLYDVESIVTVPVRLPRIEIVEGRVTVFEVGSDGRALDVESSLAQLRSVLERRLQGEPVEVVDLVTQVVPAGEDELMAEMGVMELIGEGHSSFRDSSWARVTNIVVGGQELDGRLVAPEEVFSLNDVLDPVSWEKGYVMSEIIIGGGVGYGIGGGLCQLATTLYRAVLHTGLEVVERHPHAWRLDWYEQDSPPGFDATILIGGPDLKFRNNTGHYILIETETDAEAAWQVVRIYGTSPGWQVSISEPARDGYGLYFRRTVTALDGQVLIDETVYSNY
jgi:vancomycin resistance protein YoaR